LPSVFQKPDYKITRIFLHNQELLCLIIEFSLGLDKLKEEPLPVVIFDSIPGIPAERNKSSL